jgi:polyisoprenoid-binding protein YceI
MKTTLIAGLLSLAALPVLAAPVSYDVDPSHTFASYDIGHLGFSIQSGTFTNVEGKVVLDMAAHTGSIDVSIKADSLQTFFPARDKHLKSAAFFNVTKYPTLTYKADKLVFSGDKLSRVEGSLTMLGVTRPVTLTVTRFNGGKNPMTGKEEYGANADAHIKRSDFGMTTFLPAISDDVDLKLVIEAVRAD